MNNTETNLVIRCHEGSKAMAYATSLGIPYEIIEHPEEGGSIPYIVLGLIVGIAVVVAVWGREG